MTYGGFQRFDESQAYSKRKREQLEQEESETEERKDTLKKCEEASTKIEKGTEELFQALQEYDDLRDLQDKNDD